MPKHQQVLIIGIVFVLAIIVGALVLKTQQNREPPNEDESALSPEDLEGKLPTDTVITLEEFADFQSQSCAELHPALKKLKQEYGERLNFVFRNLPMETNKNSVLAAQAAEAARRQNRFWEMHDLLFVNQQAWKDEADPRSKFLQFARDLGLDVPRFTTDLDDDQVQFRIQADRDEATRLSVEATPVIFINGRRLRSEVMTPDGIRKGIEVVLAADELPEP